MVYLCPLNGHRGFNRGVMCLCTLYRLATRLGWSFRPPKAGLSLEGGGGLGGGNLTLMDGGKGDKIEVTASPWL